MPRPSTQLALTLAACTLLFGGCLDTDAQRRLEYTCTSNADCIDGYYCGVEMQCVPGVPPTAADTTSAADLDVALDTAVAPDTSDVETTRGDGTDPSADGDVNANLVEPEACPDPLPAIVRVPSSEGGGSPAISPNGRWVAFDTTEPALDTDTNSVADIYVYDLESELLAHASTDGRLRPEDSRAHATPFAHDGFVVWGSRGDLDPEAPEADRIFQWTPDGLGAFTGVPIPATRPSIGGATGTAIGFLTSTDDLDGVLANDTNGANDFYVLDDPPRLVSGGSNALGTDEARLARAAPRAVLTTNEPSLLGFGAQDNIVLADFSNPAAPTVLTVVSRGTDGEPASQFARFPRISDDGSTIVYATTAANLGGGDAPPGVLIAADVSTATPVNEIVLRYDLSDAGDGTFDVSGSGRYVVVSTRNSLGPAVNGFHQIYMIDRATNQVALVSQSENGVVGESASQAVAVDSAGCRIAFASTSDSLVAGDTNRASDIFVAPRPTEWFPLAAQ